VCHFANPAKNQNPVHLAGARFVKMAGFWLEPKSGRALILGYSCDRIHIFIRMFDFVRGQSWAITDFCVITVTPMADTTIFTSISQIHLF